MNLYLVPFFPALLPTQPALPLESTSFCPSEQRQSQKYQTLYLKSCDRVPWMMPFQPDLIPSQFLKIKPSRGCPAPHHHSPQPTLPSCPQPPATVCNRALTVSHSSLSPRPQSVSKKWVKKPKERPVADWDRDESCHSSEHCCRFGTESPRSVSAKAGVSWWIITLADRTAISKKHNDSCYTELFFLACWIQKYIV